MDVKFVNGLCDANTNLGDFFKSEETVQIDIDKGGHTFTLNNHDKSNFKLINKVISKVKAQ